MAAFGIGKVLKNLPALRQIGFQANRRLLDVQKISHDCSIGEDALIGYSFHFAGTFVAPHGKTNILMERESDKL